MPERVEHARGTLQAPDRGHIIRQSRARPDPAIRRWRKRDTELRDMLLQPAPFQEDRWVGGALTFGEGVGAPAIAVTMPDVRCSMINLDPDTAAAAPEMLRSVVQANQNHAGIYGTVTRIGRLRVGQTVRLESPAGIGSKA